MKTIDMLAGLLIIIGAINWGLVGLFNFNIVEYLFRSMSIDRVVYVLIGFSGLYRLFCCKSITARCKK
ncbi:DUF378 domain-containing protein [Candidatus Aerophobetes bacterium]|uniref:DUF378 domain-containing protein n=1 Tax=Aerophobetes bacterium TaxID=2030807 RepID=A0A2A4X739_UNCAE|nr:MAG: DUF378 domain-containing protein [Candidatus Aerophobetes bacterium]